MDAAHVLSLLADACRQLEDAGEHAAAAYVGHAMIIVERRFPDARSDPPAYPDPQA
jgi:hypothetical protein